MALYHIITLLKGFSFLFCQA